MQSRNSHSFTRPVTLHVGAELAATHVPDEELHQVVPLCKLCPFCKGNRALPESMVALHEVRGGDTRSGQRAQRPRGTLPAGVWSGMLLTNNRHQVKRMVNVFLSCFSGFLGRHQYVRPVEKKRPPVTGCIAGWFNLLKLLSSIKHDLTA
jgi:hypothetical protein